MPWGFPCFVRFPCIHAAATTPAQRLNVSLRSFHPDVSVFPDRVVGSTCALSFSRIALTRVAACTLALSPICDTLIEGFSHFVTSMTAPIASGWSGCRMGFAPTGKRRLCTAHTLLGHLALSTSGSRVRLNESQLRTGFEGSLEGPPFKIPINLRLW
jgi:hypothetical protein